MREIARERELSRVASERACPLVRRLLARGRLLGGGFSVVVAVCAAAWVFLKEDWVRLDRARVDRLTRRLG